MTLQSPGARARSTSRALSASRRAHNCSEILGFAEPIKKAVPGLEGHLVEIRDVVIRVVILIEALTTFFRDARRYLLSTKTICHISARHQRFCICVARAELAPP